MRFSLKMLLGLLAYAALFCASILTVNALWAELFLLVTFVLLVFAANVAIFGLSERRALYGSFVVMTVAYLLITVYPGNFSGFPTSSWIVQMSNQLDARRQQLIGPPAGNPMGGMGGGLTPSGGFGTSAAPNGGITISGSPNMLGLSFITWNTANLSPEQMRALEASALNFQRVCHTVFAILLGLIVAILTQRIVERGAAERRATTTNDKAGA